MKKYLYLTNKKCVKYIKYEIKLYQNNIYAITLHLKETWQNTVYNYLEYIRFKTIFSYLCEMLNLLICENNILDRQLKLTKA